MNTRPSYIKLQALEAFILETLHNTPHEMKASELFAPLAGQVSSVIFDLLLEFMRNEGLVSRWTESKGLLIELTADGNTKATLLKHMNNEDFDIQGGN